MNVWMHKKTGELAIAKKIWIEDDMPIDDEYSIHFDISIGGWAFQNKYGSCSILPTKVQKEFEYLGKL